MAQTATLTPFRLPILAISHVFKLGFRHEKDEQLSIKKIFPKHSLNLLKRKWHHRHMLRTDMSLQN